MTLQVPSACAWQVSRLTWLGPNPEGVPHIEERGAVGQSKPAASGQTSWSSDYVTLGLQSYLLRRWDWGGCQEGPNTF